MRGPWDCVSPRLWKPRRPTAMIGRSLWAFFCLCVVVGMSAPRSGWADGDTPGTSPSYALVPKSAKRIKADLTFEIKAPKALADEWSLYFAQLPELPGQVDVRTVLSPRGRPARELSEEGRPMLYARFPAVGQKWRKDVSAHVAYEATLIERRLEARGPGAADAPAVAPLDPKSRRLELANVRHFDYQSAPFRAWLDERGLRRRPEENPVDFARRAFLVVRKGITHDEGEKVDHIASRVCEVGKSDYAGITAVYVAALRANGIPARALAGRVVIYEGQPAKNSWPHAKVEFFADGIGWVPADVAGAIRTNTSPDGLEFFGVDSAEFLTTHVDTDLILDTYFGRKTIDWLPDASWWVKGSGSMDGLQVKVNVTVQVEPRDLAEVLARKPAGKRPRSERGTSDGQLPKGRAS